jgi:coproporphyrinogen III oxidase-like Fe-S oxidoreductase
MIAETVLTRIMRRRTGSILTFSADPQASRLQPPPPETGKSYLLYLHIPFCEQLCPYCSFNRILLDRALAGDYFQALEQELRIYHDRGYVFDSIYVGGGTPTILPDNLGSLLTLAGKLWRIGQISVETNPNHLSPDMLGLLKALGVNRLSVGVQSFQDSILEAIGRYRRYGSGKQIQRRLRSARGIFDTLNVDAIFNFPMQDERMLARDLEILKSLEVDQVTFYPLMAGRKVRGKLAKLGKISFSREKRLYRRIWEELSTDYRPSSAWCFSRKPQAEGETDEHRRGNHLIDEYIVANEEYAGLGSGAFGYLQGTIYANTFSIPTYIESLKARRLPVLAARRFSRAEQLRYDFLMKMFGGSLDLRHLRNKYGASGQRELWKEMLFFRMNGAMQRHPVYPQVLKLSRRGYYFLVVLMREFFTGVNNFREDCLAADAAEVGGKEAAGAGCAGYGGIDAAAAGCRAGGRGSVPAVNPDGAKNLVRPV